MRWSSEKARERMTEIGYVTETVMIVFPNVIFVDWGRDDGWKQ